MKNIDKKVENYLETNKDTPNNTNTKNKRNENSD
jgi:hypothetical protein